MSKGMTRGLHACASVADMLGGLELIMGSTRRTKLTGSSHGGPTGRGVVIPGTLANRSTFRECEESL